MNNNYDQGGQYDQSYQTYQQPQYSTEYRQPLYEQNTLPEVTPFFVLAIVGLALSEVGIPGIIICAIALSKIRAYVDAGGTLTGRAKVAKILATIGLPVSIVYTATWVGYIVYIIVIYAIYGAAVLGMLGAAGMSGMSDAYYPYY